MRGGPGRLRGRAGARGIGRLRVLDGVGRGLRSMPTWAGASIIGATLLATWAIVAAGGGVTTSLPHLFYLPVVVAVVVFGMRGGVVAAVAAMLLCGPLMPGMPQSTLNWLVRGAMFLVMTGVFAGAVAARDALHRERVQRELVRALDLAPVTNGEDDPVLGERVHAVLDQDAFTVVYQPIFSLDMHAVIAVEALTRVAAEPARSPDQWFRAAHAQGIGVELELAAIRKALEGAAGVPPDIEVTVNLSAVTLTHPDLPEILRAAGRSVVLELTEHDVIGNYQVVRERLADLRGPGVRIAVDDAGAGAASLRHIVQLEPDVIKLDASLSRGVATSGVQEALGKALIDFATGIGAQLVVEGVEDRRDLMTWTVLGATALQGYVLARPAPIEQHVPLWTPPIAVAVGRRRVRPPSAGPAARPAP